MEAPGTSMVVKPPCDAKPLLTTPMANSRALRVVTRDVSVISIWPPYRIIMILPAPAVKTQYRRFFLNLQPRIRPFGVLWLPRCQKPSAASSVGTLNNLFGNARSRRITMFPETIQVSFDCLANALDRFDARSDFITQHSNRAESGSVRMAAIRPSEL